jgi:DNA mismatch repair ATPase MutS
VLGLGSRCTHQVPCVTLQSVASCNGPCALSVSVPAGRHPLCELLAPGTFIDNDTALGTLTASSSAGTSADTPAAAGAGNAGVKPRMLLITGPNASGKSVYMKQASGPCIA